MKSISPGTSGRSEELPAGLNTPFKTRSMTGGGQMFYLHFSYGGAGFGLEFLKISIKTWHPRQILIFRAQVAWGLPRQMVPLINQQRRPALNSQAGQDSRRGMEQSRISQQFFNFPFWAVFMAPRKSNWRSTCTGTLRQPCSKLWMAFMEVPRSWAHSFWVFCSPCRKA